MSYSSFLRRKRGIILANGVGALDSESLTARASAGDNCRCVDSGDSGGGGDPVCTTLGSFSFKATGSCFDQSGEFCLSIVFGKDNAGNDLWVAGGNSNSVPIKYSLDGINWIDGTGETDTNNTILPFNGGYTNISTIVYANNFWVAGGYNQDNQKSIWYSIDGKSWTVSDTSVIPNLDCSTIAYGNGIWAASGGITTGGGGNVMIYTSDPQLQSWSLATGTTFGGFCYSIAFGTDRFVAVGYNQSTTGNIKFSDDGMTWSDASGSQFQTEDYDANASLGYSYATCVTFHNGIFVTVGLNVYSSDNLYYSTDGVNWTPGTISYFDWHSNSNNIPLFIKFINGLWVVVGQNNEGHNIAYSTDLITWTPAGETPFGVGGGGQTIDYGQNKWNAGGFSATDNNNILTSLSC